MRARKPKLGGARKGAGAKPRAGSAATTTLTLRLTADESMRLRKAAGKLPVSAWARARLLDVAAVEG